MGCSQEEGSSVGAPVKRAAEVAAPPASSVGGCSADNSAGHSKHAQTSSVALLLRGSLHAA